MSFFDRFKQTPITDAIDLATSDGQSMEDLAFHLEICDMINDTKGEADDGAKDAARTLKKKLSTRKAATTMKALVLLESCVKNCGHEFHVEVAEKSFIDVLWKLVTGKSSLVGMARDKTLSMIQTWAEAFRNDASLGSIRELYLKLLGEGIEFPTQNLSGGAPIITPDINPAVARTASHEHVRPHQSTTSAPLSATSDEDFARQLQQQFQNEDSVAGRVASGAAAIYPSVSSSSTLPQQHPQPQQYCTEYRVQLIPEGQRVVATAAQLAKLREDMAIVWQNTRLLSDLISALGPNESAKDNELIGEVATTCDAMQKRAAKLCEQVENEDLISELLNVNDALNDAQHKLRVRLSQETPARAATPLESNHVVSSTTVGAPDSSWATDTAPRSAAASNYGHTTTVPMHPVDEREGVLAHVDDHGYTAAGLGGRGRGGVSGSTSPSYAVAHHVYASVDGADADGEQPPLYGPADSDRGDVGVAGEAAWLSHASPPRTGVPGSHRSSAIPSSLPFDAFGDEPPMFSALPSPMRAGNDEPDIMAPPTAIPHSSTEGLLVDLGEDSHGSSGDQGAGGDHSSLLLGSETIDFTQLDTETRGIANKPVNILGDGTVRGLSSSQQRKLDSDHDALFAL